MPRRAANLDLSIRHDELEQQRVQLEHNLQQTDLSLHLSSSQGDYSDVEYPRHNSVPSPPYSAFASFDHRSGDDFDPHEQSRFQAWSYHTVDADEGVHTYAAETLSTAAHHASALTISAGLGGGRGGRRDISLSGAEYDPERPLQGIVAGIAGRLKGFDANSTKSRQITTSAVDFDPLIVDDTAELDRVLQSGHAPQATIRSTRSSSTSSSSDTTEPLSPQPQYESRPRLSDALSHIAFSPKRPRSAQGLPSPRMGSLTMPTRSPTPDRNSLSRHLPRSSSPNALPASTPRLQRRMNQSLSYAQPSFSQSPLEPEVNVQPATPSLRERDQSSKFTNLARGLAREIEEEADAVLRGNPQPEATPKAYRHSTYASKPKRQARSPFHEKISERTERSAHLATPFKQRVHLPDVTGLTSAIASPARIDVEFYGYDPKETTEHEARLIATLGVVQNKLSHLEAENSVSRRRVRELELELEACKQEVARERTRIMEHEQSTHHADPVAGSSRGARAQQLQRQQKAQEDEAELAGAEVRYKAAVEEKKALEALIGTLRTHLSRLTAELADHKKLLHELRALRDSDARTLAEKGKQVDQLRQEVERLAGEVEVLRGVVEEGLKERRSFREQSESHEQETRTETAELSSDEESSSSAESTQQQQPQQRVVARAPSPHEEHSEDEESVASSSRRSPTPSPRRKPSAADRTVRTDHATLASSQIPSLSASRPFLDSEEVSRITQEIEERRSERSASMHSRSSGQSESRSHEDSRSRLLNEGRASRPTSPSMAFDQDASVFPQDAQPEPQARFPRVTAESSRPSSPRIGAQQAQPRPAAPTPAAAHRDGRQKRRTQTEPPAAAAEPETPFPQIRGAHMERLFFSLPDHNADTCVVCHRRRRRAPDVERAESWLNAHARARAAQDEDEGFVEGPEDVRERWERQARAAGDRAQDDQVPPQTVLVRVLRELEDDFAHYKSIYGELADQYKDMGPVSNVAKRNVLAEHLREVIDILEQKGNQIASLYGLLEFKDRPVDEPALPQQPPGKRVPSAGPASSRAQVRRYPSS